jgi:hypothetical protein
LKNDKKFREKKLFVSNKIKNEEVCEWKKIFNPMEKIERKTSNSLSTNSQSEVKVLKNEQSTVSDLNKNNVPSLTLESQKDVLCKSVIMLDNLFKSTNLLMQRNFDISNGYDFSYNFVNNFMHDAMSLGNLMNQFTQIQQYYCQK